MGYSIDEIAAKYFPLQVEFAGAKDTFGESGKPMDLLKKQGMDVPDIMAARGKPFAKNKID